MFEPGATPEDPIAARTDAGRARHSVPAVAEPGRRRAEDCPPYQIAGPARKASRAFSAGAFFISQILGRCPRFAAANPFRLRTNPSCVRTCGGLAMKLRLWR